MKRILIIDDDEVVLRLYQTALTRQGFQVDAAKDGLAGITELRKSPPDLVLLDLMMPKFTGVDVLKFIRGDAALKTLPVILLSNSFMNDMAGQAVALGVQRALLKVRCSPHYLVALINEVLAGQPGTVDPSQLLALPKPEPTPPPPPVTALKVSPPEPTKKTEAQTEFIDTARRDFLANAPKIKADLQELARGMSKSRNEVETDMRVNNFYRRVHFLSAAAGMANAHDIALLASAFEALLFELMGRPALLTPSVHRTVTFTTDFLAVLLDRAPRAPVKPLPTPQTLVVDDDPLSNRLISSALRRAQLTARCTQDPLVAMQWTRETHFDLVLLDIEMPGMNGLDFCKQLRGAPGYQHTPVIFVTSHGDFENRAKSILSGGNDLISKPVLPIELAVKAVSHLLKANLNTQEQAAH
jgi:CheY-like chemotaxis protein